MRVSPQRRLAGRDRAKRGVAGIIARREQWPRRCVWFPRDAPRGRNKFFRRTIECVSPPRRRPWYRGEFFGNDLALNPPAMKPLWDDAANFSESSLRAACATHGAPGGGGNGSTARAWS